MLQTNLQVPYSPRIQDKRHRFQKFPMCRLTSKEYSENCLTQHSENSNFSLSKFYSFIQLLWKRFTLGIDFFGKIIFREVHNFGERFHEILVDLIQPCWNWSQLPDLICNILENFLWNDVVLENVESLHGVMTLKVDFKCSINCFLHNQSGIFRMKFPCKRPSSTAGVCAVMEVGSLLPFVSGHCDFFRVNKDDVITAIIWKKVAR